MTTYSTYSTNRLPEQRKIKLDKRGRTYFLTRTIDCAQRNLSAADVFQCLSIPANTWVKNVFVNVITAETANATIDIGDGTASDRFGNGFYVDATGYLDPKLVQAVTWDAGSLDPGEREAKEVTVDGATIGDRVMVSPAVDVTDLTWSAFVTAANTVTIVAANVGADTVYTGGGTWDPGSILPGESATNDFTVTGAALGDFVEVGMGVDVVDLNITAQVTATNTVTVVAANTKETDVNWKSSTWNPGSIDDGNEEVVEFTVTGAALGDFVEVSSSIDLTDLTLVGAVTGTNTVTVQLGNWTGGAIDLGAITIDIKTTEPSAAIDLASNTVNLRVKSEGSAVNMASQSAVVLVEKNSSYASGHVYTSADTIDITVTADGASVACDALKFLIVAECVDINKIDN